MTNMACAILKLLLNQPNISSLTHSHEWRIERDPILDADATMNNIYLE
jgi:hypothetical protein